MSRHRALRTAAVLTGLIVLVALVVAGIRQTRPPDLESADRVTLISIDGRAEGQAGGDGETLYGNPVLGKVVIEDPGQKQELIAALKDGLARADNSPRACYWPRHVLRAEHGNRVTDYTICFQCQNYKLYVNGVYRSSGMISPHVRTSFNKPLTDANVPIAPE